MQVSELFIKILKQNQPDFEICSVPAKGVTRPGIRGPKCNFSIRWEIFPSKCF